MKFHFPSINKIAKQAERSASKNHSKEHIDPPHTSPKKSKKRNIIIFDNKQGIKNIKVNKDLNNVN